MGKDHIACYKVMKILFIRRLFSFLKIIPIWPLRWFWFFWWPRLPPYLGWGTYREKD
jgi:hypothetical protein